MTDYRTKNRLLSNNVSAHCFMYILFYCKRSKYRPSLPHLLISLSPSLPLSLSHSSPIFLSPSPTLLTSLPLSLYPSLFISISPQTSSPSLLLSLSFSPSLLLYLSPLSLPGTRTSTASRHRACYYHVSCHYQ